MNSTSNGSWESLDGEMFGKEFLDNSDRVAIGSQFCMWACTFVYVMSMMTPALTWRVSNHCDDACGNVAKTLYAVFTSSSFYQHPNKVTACCRERLTNDRKQTSVQTYKPEKARKYQDVRKDWTRHFMALLHLLTSRLESRAQICWHFTKRVILQA